METFQRKRDALTALRGQMWGAAQEGSMTRASTGAGLPIRVRQYSQGGAAGEPMALRGLTAKPNLRAGRIREV
jgi:hypothetical protein